MHENAKPERIGIEITVGGRKAWVFQRNIRGSRTENYYVQGNVPGKGPWRVSTGLSSRSMAVDRAKLLWRAKLHEQDDGVREALAGTKLRQPKPVATIGQMVQAHALAEQAGKLHVRARPAQGYRLALIRLVAWGKGLHTMAPGKTRRTMDAEAVSKLPLTVLTERDFVPEFERTYTAPAGADRMRREQLLRGAHSLLTNARAMFEPVALRAYQGLVLPDLESFMTTQMKVAREVEHGRLDDAAVREMALAALELRESDPDLYRVHLCFRHLGLRNDELLEARQEWIEEVQREVKLPGGETRKLALADGTTIEATVPIVRPVGGLMNLTLRPYWEPKRSAGVVAIAPEIMAELAEWRTGREPLDHLVPARTKTERWELIYIRHADFVRPWTAHLAKRGYELRRWGATKLALLHQSEEMAELFLRHAKRTTAQKHYLTERPLPAPITLADVGL